MKQTVDPLTESGQAAHAAMAALWDIQAGFLRKAAYLQYSLASVGLESGARQWQLLNALAARDRLVAGQKEIAEFAEPRLSAIALEAAEGMREFSEACVAWMFGTFTHTPTPAAAPARRKPRPRRTSRKKSG